MPTRIRFRTRTSASSSLADCQPCQQHREQALRDAESIARTALPEDTPPPARIAWSGPIVHEGQMTGDGRFIQPNALTWGDLPIPLRWVKEDSGEHNGAVVVGRITSLERQPNGAILARGDFDTGSPEGVEAARQVGESLTRGVSVDLDNVSFTVRVAAELLDGEGIPGEPEQQDADADGRVTVLDIDADAEIMDIDDARIRAATLLAVPAFEGARITIDDSETDSDDESDPADETVTEQPEDDQDDELVAAAAPNLPPTEWFTDPDLTGPTPITVTDDGRIYGHAAIWDSCHTGFQQECVSPPRSASNYSYFRTGTVLTADGREVPVGHITLDTFHAGKQLGAADTIAHYEHTGATVADVAAGEDEHGIWVAGAVRPNLTDDQLRSLRSSPLSGDWRRIGGNLELVAALAVNVPGFPVPRTSGLVASSGAVLALVASGVVDHNPTGPHTDIGHRLGSTTSRTETDISGEALNYLRKLTARDHSRLRAASLHRKVKAAKLADRTMINKKLIKTRGGQ